MIQIPCTLDSFKSLIHGSIKITFETQENLNTEILAQILSNQHKFGWLIFNPGEKQIEDKIELPKLINIKGKKSQSVRLRNVLYILYRQNNGDDGHFDEYYNNIMEQLIEKYKEKIKN